MKTYVLPFLFLLTLISLPSAYSQNWLPVGTQWYYNSSIWGRPQEAQIMTITGTTEIQGKTCAILEKAYASCNMRPEIDYLYKENDSLFYYDEWTLSFQLLYDFGVEAGDVTAIPLWEGMNITVPTLYIHVDSISSLFIDTLELKQFHVSYSGRPDTLVYPNWRTTIIEDAGTRINFFYRVENGFCDGYHVTNLRCFQIPGLPSLSYIPADEECDYVVSNREVDESLFQDARISPNPINNELRIVQLPESPEVNWNIYDLKGQLLIKGKTPSFAASSLSIPVDHLPPSVYLIVIKNQQGQLLFSDRFIKPSF